MRAAVNERSCYYEWQAVEAVEERLALHASHASHGSHRSLHRSLHGSFPGSQAAKAEEERLAAERAEEEGEEGEPVRPKPKKRGRKGDPRSSVEAAVEEELRRKKGSSRINYDVAAILTQQVRTEEVTATLPSRRHSAAGSRGRRARKP